MYPPTSLQKKPQIDAAVAEVLKEFSPSVKYIRFDVGQDWTGEWPSSSGSCCPMMCPEMGCWVT
jgi:hypothetical protein